MCCKIEVMDNACSQTFARKLERYFSILVPKIQAKFQKYQNKWLSRRVIFTKKNRKGGMATLPKPSKKGLRRSNFEEFTLINSSH